MKKINFLLLQNFSIKEIKPEKVFNSLARTNLKKFLSLNFILKILINDEKGDWILNYAYKNYEINKKYNINNYEIINEAVIEYLKKYAINDYILSTLKIITPVKKIISIAFENATKNKQFPILINLLCLMENDKIDENEKQEKIEQTLNNLINNDNIFNDKDIDDVIALDNFFYYYIAKNEKYKPYKDYIINKILNTEYCLDFLDDLFDNCDKKEIKEKIINKAIEEDKGGKHIYKFFMKEVLDNENKEIAKKLFCAFLKFSNDEEKIVDLWKYVFSIENEPEKVIQLLKNIEKKIVEKDINGNLIYEMLYLWNIEEINERINYLAKKQNKDANFYYDIDYNRAIENFIEIAKNKNLIDKVIDVYEEKKFRLSSKLVDELYFLYRHFRIYQDYDDEDEEEDN